MDETLNSSNGPRKYLSAKEKFSIVKEQLTTKTSVSEICKKYQIVSSQFYRWQELFFEGASERLSQSKRSGNGGTNGSEKIIEEQRREIERLKEVALEIAAENVVLKKSPGVLSTIR